MCIKQQYRPDIDGIRAIAIISVILFHFDFRYFSGGFVGVDIFFVISGFLITSLIQKEIIVSHTFSFKKFYIRRAKRLLPAFLVTLFFTTLFAILILSPTHLQRFSGALISSLLSISNFYFWLENDYFDVASSFKPLLHTWSLAIEEQFYLLWPISIVLLMKIRKKIYIIFFIIIIGLFSIYLNSIFVDSNINFITQMFPLISKDGNATIFYLLPFRFFEFLLGAILVWIPMKQNYKYFYDILFLIGLICIGYSILYFDKKIIFPSYFALIPTFGTALLIYSGYKSKFKFIITNKFMVKIGLISYSLYLIHWPIIVFINYLYDEISLFNKLFIIFISILLAFVSYKFIEQPFRKKNIRFNIKIFSIFIVLILGYIGFHIYTHNGWEWRIKSIAKFDNVGDKSNFHKKFYGGAGYPFHGGVNTQEPADIVVIGDSHARHYMEGLDKLIAKPNKLNLYSNAGTSFIMLPYFTRISKGYDRNYANRVFKIGLKFIKEGDKPLVIISQSWLIQMKIADIVDKNNKRKYKNISINDIIKGIYNLKEIIGDSKLVVIGNVPGAKYNLYDIFTRPRAIFFTTFNPKTYIKVPLDKKINYFNKRLKLEFKLNKEIIFLDPCDILCKAERCNNLDKEGHLLYSDNAHLSKYGSIQVIRGFLPQLLDLLKNK